MKPILGAKQRNNTSMSLKAVDDDSNRACTNCFIGLKNDQILKLLFNVTKKDLESWHLNSSRVSLRLKVKRFLV